MKTGKLLFSTKYEKVYNRIFLGLLFAIGLVLIVGVLFYIQVLI